MRKFIITAIGFMAIISTSCGSVENTLYQATNVLNTVGAYSGVFGGNTNTTASYPSNTSSSSTTVSYPSTTSSSSTTTSSRPSTTTSSSSSTSKPAANSSSTTSTTSTNQHDYMEMWLSGRNVGRITRSGEVWINGSHKGDIRSGSIYVSGSNKGEIRSNGDIYKSGRNIGRVQSNGDIYLEGRNIGRIQSNGDIYKEGRNIGRVTNMFNTSWVAVLYFYDFFSF